MFYVCLYYFHKMLMIVVYGTVQSKSGLSYPPLNGRLIRNHGTLHTFILYIYYLPLVNYCFYMLGKNKPKKLNDIILPVTISQERKLLVGYGRTSQYIHATSCQCW
jgi:hypothetical protein